MLRPLVAMARSSRAEGGRVKRAAFLNILRGILMPNAMACLRVFPTRSYCA
jgi:hypothetical protein